MSHTTNTVNLPKNHNSIWPIAWVSFFWSTASLMVLSVLPVFLSEELKISNKGIGMLEGIAVATAFAAKVFAGAASDYLRRRKPLIIIGSLMSVLTKPLFAISTCWVTIFCSRFLDRLGKGIRSAPTDALIANISDQRTANNNFGIRQALYALGTVLGSVIAMLLMLYYSNADATINFRLIFFFATVPALIALLILCLWVIEPKSASKAMKSSRKWQLSDLLQLPKIFWLILLITGVLMVARFSEMFMILRARELGWTTQYLPLLIITIDLFHAGAAFANKRLVEKNGEHNLLIIGFILLIIANIMFAISNNLATIIIGIVLSGLHLGLTQGILRAMIAKVCSQHLVGTAFSLFYLISGFGVLCGNMLAGSLADTYGLSAAFVGGMLVTLVAMLLFMFLRPAKNVQFNQIQTSAAVA